MTLKSERKLDFPKLTDSQKRERIDEELRQKNPEASAEAIFSKREDYLRENFGNRKHVSLPQPQQRAECKTCTLTIEELATHLSRLYSDNSGWVSGFLEGSLALFLWPLGIFGGLVGVIFLVRLFQGRYSELLHPVFLITAVFIAVFLKVLSFGKKKALDREAFLYRKVKEGAFYTRSNTVEAMGSEIDYSGDGITPEYYLYLRDDESAEPWSMWVADDEYRKLREGDQILILYFDKEAMEGQMKHHNYDLPVCLVFPKLHNPDEQLCMLMKNSKKPSYPSDRIKLWKNIML